MPRWLPRVCSSISNRRENPNLANLLSQWNNLPVFLAFFPILLSKRSFILAFCLSSGHCCILHVPQLPLHTHQQGRAGAAQWQRWARLGQWEDRRLGQGPHPKPDSALSCICTVPLKSLGFPGQHCPARAHLKIWLPKWCELGAWKKSPPSLAQLAQAPWQHPQQRWWRHWAHLHGLSFLGYPFKSATWPTRLFLA